MGHLEGIIGDLLSFDTLKILIIALALLIGVASFLCKFIWKYVIRGLSKENSRLLTYAIRIPAIILIVIPIIDIMMGAEIGIFLVGLVVTGIILLIISSKSTLGSFVEMILSGF